LQHLLGHPLLDGEHPKPAQATGNDCIAPQHNMLHRHFLTPLVLTLTLGACHAQAPAASATAKASVAVPSNAALIGGYKDTYLFDLIDDTNRLRLVKVAGVPDYASAFKRLTMEPSKKEHRFVDRLTSGPSTRGQLASTTLGQAIVHTICQAHACNMARLGVLYVPENGHMVGLVWDHCALTKLGTPSIEEIDVLTRMSKIPADTPENKKQCEQER
jgi:hypothetical protein